MFANQKRHPKRRIGLSYAELLGCLVAVVGGLWIGANYLGINLQKAAFVALDEAQVLEQIPEDWRPVNPDCPDGDCPDDTEKLRLAVLALEQERDQIISHINNRRLQMSAEPVGYEESPAWISPNVDTSNPSDPSDLTVQYWFQLSELVKEANAFEQESALLEAHGKLAQAFKLRAQIASYAVQGIELLHQAEAHPDALEAGYKLASWYESCAEHALDGKEIAKKLAGGKLSAPERKTWNHSRVQFQMLSDLLSRNLEEARIALIAEYPAQFSAIQPVGLGTAN